MRKKINKLKRIIINNNIKTKKIGIIFVKSYNKIYNKNKEYFINNTQILHKNNTFTLYSENLETIIKKYKLHNKIVEKIHIYNNNNINLFILVLKKDTNIKDYKIKHYLDLYNNTNISVYDSILNYNLKYKKNKTYLNNLITSNDNSVQLCIKDLYYYLIGYI
tara:strand:- start:222 stop:710 length:489 start_codon:yes stop_codon:yes gene_type:complete